jgi:hypothetical protein
MTTQEREMYEHFINDILYASYTNGMGTIEVQELIGDVPPFAHITLRMDYARWQRRLGSPPPDLTGVAPWYGCTLTQIDTSAKTE